jgi:hypothetical protein
MVALALYSKCIVVAEAILVLVAANFSDEAFGMTRTLVDIFFTLRYITNKDTDIRAKQYADFCAKDSVVWNEVTKLYWPHHTQTIPNNILAIASKYPSPHSWSGKTAKDMALEPDTIEVDPKTGNPFTHDFAYQVIYRWTSHYVHPTIGALESHLVQAGRDVFAVRSGRGKDMTHMAVFNAASYVAHTMIFFYRCLGDDQPPRLRGWSQALLKHLAKRHA